MRNLIAPLAALLVAASIFFAGEQAQPVGNVIEPAFAPTEAAHPFCHPGWTAEAPKTLDTVSYTCARDGYTVILNTDSGAFVMAEKDGRFITNEAEVPGW